MAKLSSIDNKSIPSDTSCIDLKVNDWVIALYGKRKKEIIANIISIDQNLIEVQFINWRDKDDKHPNGKLFDDTYKLPYDDIKKKIDFDINNLYVDKAEQWKRAIPYMKKDWALRQDQCFSKATSALNKLTPENFDKISSQFLENINQIQIFNDKTLFEELKRNNDIKKIQEIKEINLISYDKINQLTILLIKKAGLSKTFVGVYANLCSAICNKINHNLFKKLLIQNCRTYFQGDELLKSKRNVNEITQEKNSLITDVKKLTIELSEAKINNMESEDLKVLIDKKQKAEEKAEQEKLKLEQEKYDQNILKKNYINYIAFIGELFKVSVVKCIVINDCILTLFENPEEWEIECICKIICTIGEKFDTMQNTLVNSKNLLDQYLSQLEDIRQNKQYSSRIRFMILDLIELRARNWKLKSSEYLPKTIKQIHEDFKSAEI